jgi:GT2 family glycosyltransferase
LNSSEKIIAGENNRPSIDIIIVNWNSGELLRNCIQSIPIAINSSFRLNRIIVVDNNSSDNSLSFEFDLNLPISFIKNHQNSGFARACNQGAYGSEADFLLFLNPDTRLYNDSLSIPSRFLSCHPRVGIVGVQLVNEKGEVARNCARFPSVFSMIYSSFGLNRIFPKIFPGQFMKEWDHLADSEVDQVMGSFFMIRRDLFVRLRGYDESFFVYFEDLDLALRAKKLGFSNFYLSGTRIYHKGGGTTESIKAMRLALILHSKLIYCKKHFNKVEYFFTFWATIFIEPVTRLVDLVLKGNPGEMKEVLKGYKLLFRRLLA